MEALLHEPLVRSGLLPLAAGFLVTLVLFPLRVGGLAAIAGFCTTAWLTGDLQASGRLMLVAMAAPTLGLLADFAFRSGRTTAYILGVLFAAASLWVFARPLLSHSTIQMFIVGGGIAVFIAWTAAWTATLQGDSVRAGAAGLGLGLGLGFATAGSSELGMALGAASGGFLLVQILFGRRILAGLVFCLALGVAGSLVAADALLRRRLGWIEIALLALVPVAARLPLPARWPVWAQSFIAAFYALACGGGAVAVAYLAKR